MKKLAMTLVATVWMMGTLGCASQSSTAPTHRWASQDAIDQVQYRQDDARCRDTADMDRQERVYAIDSPQFLNYKNCMADRGYVLTAYNK